MEKRENAAVAIFYLALAAFIFRKLLLDGGVWNYGDSSFPVDDGSMDYLVESLKSVWWNRSFLGYDTTFQTIHSASFILAWKALSLVFDYSTIQFLWYVVVFFVSAFSMYGLTRYLFASPLIAFASGLFYALNPWAMERLIVFPIYQAYAFIPILMLTYCLFMKWGRFKYALAFALCSFFIIVSLHYTFYAVLLVGSYSLYNLLVEKKTDFKKYIVENAKLVGLTMALLAFYALPLFYSLALRGGGTATEALKRFSTEHVSAYFYGKDLTVANALRLLGFHDTFYSDPPAWFTLLSFVLPILLVLPLLARAATRLKTLYFFYFCAVVGVLLSSSTKLMSEAAYKATLLKLPVLKTLASLPDPYYHTFLISFAYGPILGAALFLLIQFIEDRMRGTILLRFIKPGFMALFIFFTAAISYPALSWKDLRHTQFEYSKEYLAVARFLQENAADTRVFVWPPAHSVKHEWAPYFICNFDKFVFNVDAFGTGIAEATPRGSLEFMNALKTSVADKMAFVNMLRFANVKYVVFMKDTEDAPPYVYSEHEMNAAFMKTINDASMFKPVRQFGAIAIYAVEDKYVLPAFYAPDDIRTVNGSLVIAAALSENSAGKPAFLKSGNSSESIKEVADDTEDNSSESRFNVKDGVAKAYSFYVGSDGQHEISAVFNLKKEQVSTAAIDSVLKDWRAPIDLASAKKYGNAHPYFFSKGFSGPKELKYPLSKGQWRESSGKGEVIIFSPHKSRSKGDLLFSAACLGEDCALELTVNSKASWTLSLKPEGTRFRISGVELNPGANKISFVLKKKGKAEGRFAIGEYIKAAATGFMADNSPAFRVLKYSQGETAYSVVSKKLVPTDLNDNPLFSLDYSSAGQVKEMHVGFRVDSDNDGMDDIYFARELRRDEKGHYEADLFREIVKSFASELKGPPRLIGVDVFTVAAPRGLLPSIAGPHENVKRMRLGSKTSFIEEEAATIESFSSMNARTVAADNRRVSVYPLGKKDPEMTIPLDVRRLEGSDYLRLSFSAPKGRIELVRTWLGYDNDADGVADKFEPLGRRHSISEWTLKDPAKGTYAAQAPDDLKNAWMKYNLILMKGDEVYREIPSINNGMVEAALGIYEPFRDYGLWYVQPSDIRFHDGVAELLLEAKDPLRRGSLVEVRFTIFAEKEKDAFVFSAPEYISTFDPEISRGSASFLKVDGEPLAFVSKKLSAIDDTMALKTKRFLKKGVHRLEFTGTGHYSEGFAEVKPSPVASEAEVKAPDVSFERESSTRYMVRVKNVVSPFTLVFSQSYDDKWSAAVEPQGGSEPAKIGGHFMVNGYANAWKVEPDGAQKDFTIIVEYEPQRFYIAGIGISCVALFGSVIFLSGRFQERRTQR